MMLDLLSCYGIELKGKYKLLLVLESPPDFITHQTLSHILSIYRIGFDTEPVQMNDTLWVSVIHAYCLQ